MQAPLNAVNKPIRRYAADAKASPTEVSSILEQRIRGVQEEAGLAETGRVLSVGCVDSYHNPNTPHLVDFAWASMLIAVLQQ